MAYVVGAGTALSGGLVTIAGAVVIALALPAFARYSRQQHKLARKSPRAATAKA